MFQFTTKLLPKEIWLFLNNFDLRHLYLTGGFLRKLIFNPNQIFKSTNAYDLDFIYNSLDLLKYKIFDKYFTKFYSFMKQINFWNLSFTLLRHEYIDTKTNTIKYMLGSWSDDVARRDFVCNAIYVNMKNFKDIYHMDNLTQDIQNKQLSLINSDRFMFDASIIPRLIRLGIEDNLIFNINDIPYFEQFFLYNKTPYIFSDRTIKEFKNLFSNCTSKDIFKYIYQNRITFCYSYIKEAFLYIYIKKI